MPARAGLDRRRVLDAAEALADREGPDGLSLAGLARALGVKTPSLYNHVSGLPGLRGELRKRGLRALADALAQAGVGRAGADAVVAIAHAYRAYAVAHPGLYALAQEARDETDEGLRAAERDVVDVVLRALRGFGLEGDDALHATRCLRSALHGFVALESGGGFGLALDTDASFDRLVGLLARGLAEPPGGAADGSREGT